MLSSDNFIVTKDSRLSADGSLFNDVVTVYYKPLGTEDSTRISIVEIVTDYGFAKGCITIDANFSSLCNPKNQREEPLLLHADVEVGEVDRILSLKEIEEIVFFKEVFEMPEFTYRNDITIMYKPRVFFRGEAVKPRYVKSALKYSELVGNVRLGVSLVHNALIPYGFNLIHLLFREGGFRV